MSTTTQNSQTVAPHGTSFSVMMTGANALCAVAYNNIMAKSMIIYLTAVIQQSELYKAVSTAALCAGEQAFQESYSQGTQSITNGWGEIAGGGLGVACSAAGWYQGIGAREELKGVNEKIGNAELWKTQIETAPPGPAVNAGQNALAPNEDVRYEFGNKLPRDGSGLANNYPAEGERLADDWMRKVETGEAFDKAPILQDTTNINTYAGSKASRADLLKKTVAGRLTELRKSRTQLNQQLSAIDANMQQTTQIGSGVVRGACGVAAGKVAEDKTAPASKEKLIYTNAEQLSQAAIKVNEGTSSSANQWFQGGADAEIRTAQASSKA